MKKIICDICGNELEVEDNAANVECKYCGHVQQLEYNNEELNKILENYSSVFSDEEYARNPELLTRIKRIAEKIDHLQMAQRCESNLKTSEKKNEEEMDALVMELATAMDTVNNHWAELLAGQKKVASAIENIKKYRDEAADKAMSIQMKIDSVSSITNIDLFKGRKVDDLKRMLVNVESEIRDFDNKSADVSRGWSQLYTEKLMEIVKAQSRQKAIRSRIKALESFKNSTGSELALNDPHYLNLFALNNDLSGIIRGSLFTFGKYKGETLVWRVLAFNPERILVISENVIEVGAYTQGMYSVKGYESSDIRRWMNEQLVYDLFSSAELKSVDVIGNDRLFLLEASQAAFMFNSDSERLASPTAYAIKKGVAFSTVGKGIYSPYWLSTINEATMNKFAYTVESNGSISKQDGVVNIGTYGIRPAMWLSIKK